MNPQATRRCCPRGTGLRLSLAAVGIVVGEPPSVPDLRVSGQGSHSPAGHRLLPGRAAQKHPHGLAPSPPAPSRPGREQRLVLRGRDDLHTPLLSKPPSSSP